MRTRFVLALLLLAGALARAEDTYEIGPGDVLRIVVLGQTEMTGEMPVDPEGMLVFPVLGRVKASDMTAKDLERKLTTLLADGYLKRPDVSVTVREYRSQKVYVTGEVQRPGVYALKSDRTLLALLGEVGSLTPNAGHEVLVIRPPKGVLPPSPEGDIEGAGVPAAPPGAETMRISLVDLRARPEANVPLQLGDTVHVPRASQVYVSGHVARPGAYRYETGMTLRQALVLAGGVTERGAFGRAKIIRFVDGKKSQVKIKADAPIEPEDTIVVPERFF